MELFQTFKSIKLEYKTTYETGLCEWKRTQFCQMEATRYIIFFGKEEDDDPAALHIYSFKNGWNKVGTKPVPCSHEELYILPITIENSERLLVSCHECEVIWFCDIHSGAYSEALRNKWYFPGAMCKAEGDYIVIVNSIKDNKMIQKASCTPTKLYVDKMKGIHSWMDSINHICYLPDVKCVAVSSWLEHVVKAIHCETGEETWEVKGEVAGVKWEPHGFFYSQEYQSLLVCDRYRLVILDPKNGSVLQVIPLPIPGLPVTLSVHDGRVILYHKFNCAEHICVFVIE